MARTITPDSPVANERHASFLQATDFMQPIRSAYGSDWRSLATSGAHKQAPVRFQFRVLARPVQSPTGARTDPGAGYVRESGCLRFGEIMSLRFPRCPTRLSSA